MPSVLEMLKMKKAPAGDPAPVIPPVVETVTPVVNPAPDKDAVNARVAELEAQLAAAKAGANVTLTGEAARALVPDLPPGASVITSAATAEKAIALAAVGENVPATRSALASVTPPDVPASNTTAPAADPIPAEQLATMSPAIQEAAKAVAAEYAASQVAPVGKTIAQIREEQHAADLATGPKDGGVIVGAPAGTPAPEAPKPKRGRPPKSTPPSGIGTSPSGPKEGGVIIMVDTIVHGAEPESLDAYFDAMVARMCEKDGIADVRMAPKDSFLAYGQWRPVIDMMVKSEPPAPGLYSFRVGGDDVRLAFAWALQSVPGAIVVWGGK